MIFSSAQLSMKTSRSTQGVSVMTLKKKAELFSAKMLQDSGIQNVSRYRSRTLPGSGALLKDEDRKEQQTSMIL